MDDTHADLIPPSAVVRQQLAESVVRTRVLRKLLKLAQERERIVELAAAQQPPGNQLPADKSR